MRSSRPKPGVVLAIVAAAGAAGTWGAPSLAQCPTSTTQGPSLSTMAPAFYDSNSCGVVDGDHVLGRYRIHNCGTLSPTVLTARDRFDVTGVPAGTEVSVVLRFLVEGWAYTGGCGASGCCGSCIAVARAGADTAITYMSGHTFGGRADFNGVVELPVVLTAGVPRDIEVELQGRRCAGGAHSVDATGQIVFDGTDPDALVSSCKGFGPVTVPVLNHSWGSLKTMYR